MSVPQTLYIWLECGVESTLNAICSKHCHRVRSITEKVDTVPGKRRGQTFKASGIYMHTCWKCDRYKHQIASTKQRLKYILQMKLHFTLNHVTVMLLWGWVGRAKWTSGLIYITLDVINILFLIIKLSKLIRPPCFSLLLSSYSAKQYRCLWC